MSRSGRIGRRWRRSRSKVSCGAAVAGTTPDAKAHRASTFPGAGCRDCRRPRVPCKRHLAGRTTCPAPPRPCTDNRQAEIEPAFRPLFDRNSNPPPASSPLLFPSFSRAWRQMTWLDPTWMADTAEPKQLTAASALATPILSGETHADPCRHLHVYAAPQCGARKTDPLIVPRPAWRRRNSVSTAFPDGACAISSANPCDHGREQALAIGEQRQRGRRVRLWQDADCSRSLSGIDSAEAPNITTFPKGVWG